MWIRRRRISQKVEEIQTHIESSKFDRVIWK